MNTLILGIWLYSPQLIVNEIKLQAGRLMAAARNGQCGKETHTKKILEPYAKSETKTVKNNL